MPTHLRLMTPEDIPAGMRLKDQAGWNQTAEDWARFLRFSPEGCFVAEVNGEVVGSAATIIYEGGVAWIGMVLVDPAFRGKGLGTALFERAVNHLDGQRVPCIKLDATPQGRPLYERIGFKLEYEIDRRVLHRAAGSHDSAPEAAMSLADVWKLDREVFGADRNALLQSAVAAAPELVALERDGAGLHGYALGRHGSHADHLGPWVAQDELAAQRLLERFLERSRRDAIIVDVLRANGWAPRLAQQYGFERSRPLSRMYKGNNASPGRPDLVCSILGPEFG